MGLLQLAVTWYMLEGKLPTGTSKTKKIQIYLDISHFVLDFPVGSLPSSMYHVTASCKRPIQQGNSGWKTHSMEATEIPIY